MPDEPNREDQDQIKPLSLESAIVDVAPRVTPDQPKPADSQQTGQRKLAQGRISLKKETR